MTYRRTLCVGDIHGAHRALLQVLERSGFDRAQDRLISLGDLTDYHPDSDKVLDTLMGIPHLVAVRGNHDTWAQEYLQTGERDAIWLYNGGDVTVEALEKRDATTQERYRRFFFKQVPYFIDEANRLFVHASIDNELDIEDQTEETLYWGRQLWTKAALSGMKGEPFPENSFHEIYVGHTPTHKFWPDAKPVHFGNIWNLDQGIKRSGRLTILDVESKAYWQSDWAEEFLDL
jgi:serine/threonine protein phosphatase 1